MTNKFEEFEWLAHGITAKSPSFELIIVSTGKKAVNYEDRLGAIGSMDTQLAKSVTSFIVFGHKPESDYNYMRNHLAQIMLVNAKKDKKREPEHIAIYHLAWLIARLVIDFALNPELENFYTPQGRLHYAGIGTQQMASESYRKTWKHYENLMTLAIESAIDEASEAIEKYKKNTYKELKV